MRSDHKMLAAANIFLALSLWASISEAGNITYFTDSGSYQKNNVGLNLSILNTEANQVLSLLLDRRINDFFQDGKVDLVKNEQSSLFNLNGVPNYFTSTWSSDGGPLVHDTYETYRIIFNGRFRNEVIQSIWETHPSFPDLEVFVVISQKLSSEY